MGEREGEAMGAAKDDRAGVAWAVPTHRIPLGNGGYIVCTHNPPLTVLDALRVYIDAKLARGEGGDPEMAWRQVIEAATVQLSRSMEGPASGESASVPVSCELARQRGMVAYLATLPRGERPEALLADLLSSRGRLSESERAALAAEMEAAGVDPGEEWHDRRR